MCSKDIRILLLFVFVWIYRVEVIYGELLDSIKEKYGLSDFQHRPVDPASLQSILLGVQHENPDSLYLLGLLKYYGYEQLANGPREKEVKTAVQLFKKAAQKGHADAQFALGMALYSGEGGIGVNEHLSSIWLSASAHQHHPDAQWMLATMLNEGRGVEKNSDEARALLEASAEQGNMHAKYHLGVMYEYGRGGLKQNFNRAADLYEEAVKGRVLDAMYYLGLMYVQGRGRTQDSHRAIELFKMAAVKSHAPSLYALGKMYFDGEGTDIDYSLAASYFKKAGAQEDPRVREIADREAEQIELLLEQVENNIRQNEQQIGYPITVQIASVQ